MTRHFIEDDDLSAAEQSLLLQSAQRMKDHPQRVATALQGKTLGMIFAKSSTRTRVSFEVGMLQLGGHALFLPTRDNQLGRGESLADTGAVLSRYLSGLSIRTFAHADVQALAAASAVPVINALDDLCHPCQALADLLTLRQCKGDLRGLVLTYVGDGNNMAHSLMRAGALSGMLVRILTPQAHAPQTSQVQRAQKLAHAHGGAVQVGHTLDLLQGADAVYTDVWTSMGQEGGTEAAVQARLQAFAGLQVNAALMARAKADALFLHCLPAHRGEEVSAEVIDGPASKVFEQAENRLHAQKALLCFLLTGQFC
jgi:ornithine carbamoyltransferase